MNTRYPRRYEPDGLEAIGWMIFVMGCVAALLAAALPTLLIGFLAQRYLSRFRWSGTLWLALLIPSCALFGWLYLAKGGQEIFVTQVLAFIAAYQQHQAVIEKWPWRELWSLTWPMWVYTLAAIPIWAFFLETGSQLGSSRRTQRILLDEESRRERKRAAHQKKASKRANQSKRIPDTAAGSMVVGVPIKDEEK